MQTDENILKECLERIMQDENLLFGENADSEEAATLCEYAYNQFEYEPSNEEVSLKMNEIYIEYVLESLIKKGYVEPEFLDNGTIVYSLADDKQSTRNI